MTLVGDDFSDVTLVIEIPTFVTYPTYLTYLVIIAKEVKIVKEVISCDVSPVATFYLWIVVM